mmetsp:Transcript_9994/g.29338  ORF Transcript_9994/g.29338 Transcript_9994/m.29338 type:complete len:204 (+) Transcript_9994:1014-1625(+)
MATVAPDNILGCSCETTCSESQSWICKGPSPSRFALLRACLASSPISPEQPQASQSLPVEAATAQPTRTSPWAAAWTAASFTEASTASSKAFEACRKTRAARAAMASLLKARTAAVGAPPMRDALTNLWCSGRGSIPNRAAHVRPGRKFVNSDEGGAPAKNASASVLRYIALRSFGWSVEENMATTRHDKAWRSAAAFALRAP